MLQKQNMKENFPGSAATKDWIRNPFAAISQIETFELLDGECDVLVDLVSGAPLNVIFSKTASRITIKNTCNMTNHCLQILL
jgi:hypothetical protein